MNSNKKSYKMSDVSDDVKHELFDGGVAEVFRRLVLVLRFKDVLHDEDDVLDELSVGLVDDDLNVDVTIKFTS